MLAALQPSNTGIHGRRKDAAKQTKWTGRLEVDFQTLCPSCFIILWLVWSKCWKFLLFFSLKQRLPLLLSLRLPRFDMCSSRLCKSYRPYIVCYQLLFTWNQCKTLHHVLKLRIFWAVVGQSLPLVLPHPRSQSLPCSRICRPSLTHIRFPLKCDFYCSKGAGSWISLSQPFPVSFWKGSAAMLHFLPPFLPHIFSGTNLDSKACLWWSLDFQRRKKIALRKKGGDPPTHTSTHKCTNTQTSPCWFCI